MEFTPTAENEEAGLVIRGNDKNHYDLLVTMRNGRRTAILRQYLDDKEADVKTMELPEKGEVTLSISSTPAQYQFYVKCGNKKVRLIGTADTRNLANEVIYGFTGVFIGMYASGNGTACKNPADFDWFEFVEKDKR